MPKRRRKATHNNGGYSTAFIAVEAQWGVHLIIGNRRSSPGPARNELCTWGEPTIPGVVGSPSRKRYTQYPGTLNKTGRDTAETKVKTERGPVMEEMLCAMLALKSANGRQTHHT
jgi:hypothetical protein